MLSAKSEESDKILLWSALPAATPAARMAAAAWGLAIAKSFTEACGGTLCVKGDGDLFTASVSFPLFRDVSTPPSAPGHTETNRKDDTYPTN